LIKLSCVGLNDDSISGSSHATPPTTAAAAAPPPNVHTVTTRDQRKRVYCNITRVSSEHWSKIECQIKLSTPSCNRHLEEVSVLNDVLFENVYIDYFKLLTNIVSW